MAPLDLSQIFDPDKTRRPGLDRLAREGWSFLTYRPALPDRADLPPGDGRPVLVIPGMLGADIHTTRMRGFLDQCGFRAFGWGLGNNWGPTPRLLDGLQRRLHQIHAAHGPVVLVGHSLGGLFARNLAYDHPGDVRHVITVASPLRLPTASNLEPIVRLIAGRYSPAMDLGRLRTPLPVPATVIYTRDDGIIASDSCLPHDDAADLLGLNGAHLTLCNHPEALRAIVRVAADAPGCATA